MIAVGAAAFVVLAGGSGSRVGADINKVYLPVAGRPLLSWSLAWADLVPEVGRMVVVHRAGEEAAAQHALQAAQVRTRVDLVTGGSTRHGSEQAALDLLTEPVRVGQISVIAIHDGARALAGAALLRDVLMTAAAHGGAVPTLPEPRCWPVDATGRVLARPEPLHRVQTPQAFRAGALLAAYQHARQVGSEGSDTAATMEAGDLPVHAVRGHPNNLKLTFAADLALVERQLLETVPHNLSGQHGAHEDTSA